VPFVLIVHPALQVDKVEDLVRLAKAKPGALSYASAGAGAAHHVYIRSEIRRWAAVVEAAGATAE
jgi:tripartite-type tricarboxylate transporter receptor subunit TctC